MKPQSERLEECVAMRMWMRSVQIDDDPACRDLKARMAEFAKSGQTSSGAVYVPKIDRRVVYMLSNRQDSKIALQR